MTGHDAPGRGTSSADPFLLSTYATDGTGMATTLSEKVTALAEATDAHTAAGETIPGLSDLITAVTDLTADWHHLDEFAGDVAAGFIATLGPGYHHDGSPLVLTVDDRTLDDLAHIGLADRDRAIAEAEELAADYQALLDGMANGDPLVWDPPGSDSAGVSLDTIERMASLLAAYSDDPAFAVTFTETMGVNGMVDIRELLRTYAQESPDVGRPRGRTWTDDTIAAWVDDQMAGPAAVLHTAMDTRRDTTRRTDPENADLGEVACLDEKWVDRFENYGGDAQLDYSLLVRDADLPADVMIAVGDNHLGDHFGFEDRGPGDDGSGLSSAPYQATDADLNIAAAIAANPDASLGWLTGDGIDSGTANVELVLTSRVDDADIYSAFADIVDTGLTHPADAPGRGELMEQTIRIVADPDNGGIHVPRGGGGEDAAAAMRGALGNGAAANMDVLHAMITDDWPHADTGQSPPEDALRTHDFLREVMVDTESADAVAQGYVTYAIEHLNPDVLPVPGVDTDPDDLLSDRQRALQELGTLEGTIIEAENNALIGAAEVQVTGQQRPGRVVNGGLDVAFYAGAFVPGVGQVVGGIDAAADVAGLDPGAAVFPAEEAAVEEAEEESRAATLVADVNMATLNALANGAEPPPIDSADGVTDEERQRYIDWLRPYSDPDARAHISSAFFRTTETFEDRR